MSNENRTITKRKRRVKFSKKDELQYIEPRGKSPVRPSNLHDPVVIDDEVKDHPIFANSLFILNLRFYILSNPKPGYNFGSFFKDFKHIRG